MRNGRLAWVRLHRPSRSDAELGTCGHVLQWEGLGSEAEMKRAQCLTFLLLVIGAGAVEKIRIDPATRLYRGAQDGRVYMFHGLDTENSSPPWTLRTLDQQQIQLMKTVKWLVHVVEPQSSFLHPSFLSSFHSPLLLKGVLINPFPHHSYTFSSSLSSIPPSSL